MVKKKPFNIQKLMVLGGIPTAVIAILGFIIASSKTITVYAELPKTVEETKQEVGSVQEYIMEQRLANKLMQQMVSKEKEPILSPDGKQRFNEATQKWEKVK